MSCLTVACLVAGLAWVGAPATATTPGLNGRLVVAAGFDSNLWLGRADGTEPFQLTSGGSDYCPAVSPSGAVVAFCRGNGNGYDLWLVDADGTDLRQLTDYGENTAASDPTFSSSTPRVAFVWVRNFAEVRGGRGLTYDLRSVRVDGTKTRQLTRSGAWHDASPAFSPGGHRLLWIRVGATTQNRGMVQLWTMRADGEDKRMVRSENVGNQGADWSPGGRRIVYRALHGLDIVALDGTLERHLKVNGRNPVWSPNGRWIALEAKQGIRLVSRDGQTVRRVPSFWGEEGTPFSGFAWQPLPQ